MCPRSKSFPQDSPASSDSSFPEAGQPISHLEPSTVGIELGTVYALVEAALWSEDTAKVAWTLAATACIMIFIFRRRASLQELGLSLPRLRDTLWSFALTAMLALIVLLGGWLLGTWNPRHPFWPPLQNPHIYAIWCFVQQFLLQSFFFLRLESALRSSRFAVVLTALLFSVAHIPNPILMVATLTGGLLFCDLFRRYRNLYLVSAVHTLLGFALAESFSTVLMRHMRVGIGFLHSH